MTLPAEETLLILSGMGIPLYSARGLSCTLNPIDQDKAVDRTINGELIDMSLDIFQKYQTEITCTDQQSPALDNIWIGQKLTIWWPVELSYATGHTGSPGRAVVSGSSRVVGSFTFYRPIFAVMVTDFTHGADEYSHDYNWKLTAQEWAGTS